jgi:hypothetical protein
VTSSTTSNAAIAVQPPCGRAAARTRISSGSGRRGGICRVGAPRRCHHIACVAPLCICPRGARNAAPPDSRTGCQAKTPASAERPFSAQ